MVREILSQIAELLQRHNSCSTALLDALNGDDEKLWVYLVSNGLWGGAGSVANQALLGLREERKKLDALMIRLGRQQMEVGRVNVRTAMWVSAFEEWQAGTLR